jgi:hypothetical protein
MGTLDYSKAIRKSQHCQRNWDLSRNVSTEDIELLKVAVTECPSKQNIAFYNVYFITNREIVEKVHEATDGFTVSLESPHYSVTNSQVLANLLVVFEELEISEIIGADSYRNSETYKGASLEDSQQAEEVLRNDQKLATGIAAGYLNLMSSILGYSTGCCSCFDGEKIKEILNLKNQPTLLMGVGFANPKLGRRIHHKNHDFLFPTKQKQNIKFKLFE